MFVFFLPIISSDHIAPLSKFHVALTEWKSCNAYFYADGIKQVDIVMTFE
jgi:hypothetical protein